MAQITYPNQKMVMIHKPKYTQDFLQVGKEEWMSAFADLAPNSFGVYLYLCGNRHGYRLGLSSAALQNMLCFSDSSYRRAVKELKEKGYLVQTGKSSNVLEFYTVPKRDNETKVKNEPVEELIGEDQEYEKMDCEVSLPQNTYYTASTSSYPYDINAFGWEENE